MLIVMLLIVNISMLLRNICIKCGFIVTILAVDTGVSVSNFLYKREATLNQCLFTSTFESLYCNYALGDDLPPVIFCGTGLLLPQVLRVLPNTQRIEKAPKHPI